MARLHPAGSLLALLVLLAPLTVTQGAGGRPLSLDDRVLAQQALEEVYWRHRVWPEANPTPKPALSAVMSEGAIRAKVVDYLALSNALEVWWQRPVTPPLLQAELDRMSRNTSDSTMLRELYAALGNDPYLIAETLGRQALVERLARNWYASDDRIHGELRRTAREALARIRDVGEMETLGGDQAVTTFVRRSATTTRAADDAGGKRVELEDADWERFTQTLARRFSPTAPEAPLRKLSPLQEDADRFSAAAVLMRTDDEIEVATVSWVKRPFDAWWEEQRLLLSPLVQSTDATFRLDQPAVAGCEPDSWTQRFYSTAARESHTAVWTGTEMIVWGGFPPDMNTGGRYEPATDTWKQTSMGAGVPSPRHNHTAVWTGTEMIVWGGDYLNTGGRYNPATDSWIPTSTGGDVPLGRSYHTAVWTGTEMIVWGGAGELAGRVNTGGRYNPVTDVWKPTSTGPNVPSARMDAQSVWTAQEMIVWGGSTAFNQYTATGGRYDPATNAWVATTTTGAPAARVGHTAVWTGEEMIVWGGGFGSNQWTASGGRYNPATDAWMATTTTGAPAARGHHTAVWTGEEMIVWGGLNASLGLATGGRYLPSADSWVATSLVGAPEPRFLQSVVWTGGEMIVWGGQGSSIFNSGGRYDPSSNSWVSTSNGSGVPSGRNVHTAVSTGAEMIVWGGSDGSYLNTGGRYDPATDDWVPTPTPNAPSARGYHTALWTGTEMIVWGGYPGPLNTGGRYNPATNAWSPTSTGAGVPPRREAHSVVWTGSRMIVWGGYDNGTRLQTGGRYDPVVNAWAPTTLANAPSPRAWHTAVWSGQEMIVWAGSGNNDSLVNTGARYDPVTDGWTPTSTVNVPLPRAGHTAVWSDAGMIVWGGGNGTAGLDTGGRYDPVANGWTPTSTGGNAPSPRSGHTAIWSGAEMIVWGGMDSSNADMNTGGRYDPTTDGWLPTSTGSDSPAARRDHTAVRIGTQMVVWGGYPWSNEVSFYCSCGGTYHRDADGDGHGDPAYPVVALDCSIPAGYARSSDDCDDANPAAHPGASEICDGADNDCNTAIDDGIAPPAGHPSLHGTRSGETAVFSWPALPDATHYDVTKGSLEVLQSSAGDFSASTTGCLVDDHGGLDASDGAPAPPGGGFWYLVRPVNCGGNGSYDGDGPAQVGGRDAEIAGSLLACP